MKSRSLFLPRTPTEEQAKRIEYIRSAAIEYAEALERACPKSADLSAAIRKVREASMTAVAAIVYEESDK